MVNGMTVEEFNAHEKRRASIVAKLHGYIPFDEGDTEESLKAEFLELTGVAYRSQEEEQAANVEAVKERRQQRIEAQLDSDHAIIAEAKANGFMACRAIRDALGWDKPRPDGSYYSSMQVAFRWIEKAGEEVVYLIPDGITDVTKSERTGCYPDAFARVLAVKEKRDADREAREQKSWDDAAAQKNAYDEQKADELAALILKQTQERGVHAAEQAERYAQIDAARDAEILLLIAEADAADAQILTPARRTEVMDALRSYIAAGLPLNRNGLPPRKALNAHAGFRIEGWEKRECWPEVQGG